MASPNFLPPFDSGENEHVANWVWTGTVWVPQLGAADGSIYTTVSITGGLTPKFKAISASTSGANIVVAAVTAKKIRVLEWIVSVNAAVNFKWQSHTIPTDLTGLFYTGGQGQGAGGGYSAVGLFETIAGESLDINLSGNVAVGGSLVYVEV